MKSRVTGHAVRGDLEADHVRLVGRVCNFRGEAVPLDPRGSVKAYVGTVSTEAFSKINAESFGPPLKRKEKSEKSMCLCVTTNQNN